MRVTVITGSPHRNGTTASLAEQFIKGAEEAGHEIFRFDAAFEKVDPCYACERCGMGSAVCVLDDSMEKLNPELLAADAVVLVTPVYYFGMSAQLKTVIDRFYAKNYRLHGSGKKALLIAACSDTAGWAMQPLEAHYEAILKYLGWASAGMLLANGCGSRVDLERTDYPAKAYQLGYGL